MSKSLDRIRLLETFVRISDRGSISAASRDLGLSQASASRQLKELEGRFGAQLIRRTTHSLALTSAGRDLLRDARELISDWSVLEERHSASDGLVKGPLHVVAPVALGQRYLADIALTFQMENPQVSLNWHLEDSVIRFAEIGCDCWIKVGEVPDDTLIVRKLGSVERMLVASPGLLKHHSIITPENLQTMPFIALTPFEGGRITLHHRRHKDTRVELNTVMTTNNIFSVHRAALKGMGAAVLPRWFIERDLEEKRLVDMLPEWRATPLNINVAFLPARHQPRRLELFLDALAREVPRIPGMEHRKGRE